MHLQIYKTTVENFEKTHLKNYPKPKPNSPHNVLIQKYFLCFEILLHAPPQFCLYLHRTQFSFWLLFVFNL